MDLTPKYIKMCEKAEEIQKEWKPTEGDVVFVKIKNKICWVFQSTMDDVKNKEVVILTDGSIIEKNLCVWLVRQDQLQEMIITSKYCDRNYALLTELADFHYHHGKCNWSMEQLCLAFVMHEKYGKVWDNEKEEWRDEEKY